MDTAQKYQFYNPNASNINATLYLIAAHQKTEPRDPANTLSINEVNNAIFDNVFVKEYCVEFDGVR